MLHEEVKTNKKHATGNGATGNKVEVCEVLRPITSVCSVTWP